MLNHPTPEGSSGGSLARFLEGLAGGTGSLKVLLVQAAGAQEDHQDGVEGGADIVALRG
jgi:hypothetical protein